MAVIYKKGGLSVYQGNDNKKETGRRKVQNSKRRKYEYGRYPILTKIGKDEELRYVYRCKFGVMKVKAKEVLYANVLDKKTGKYFKAKILEVVKNPNDKNLDRKKIITKNTIIKTEKGNAVVVSRPGQDGVINAVLLQ